MLKKQPLLNKQDENKSQEIREFSKVLQSQQINIFSSRIIIIIKRPIILYTEKLNKLLFNPISIIIKI